MWARRSKLYLPGGAVAPQSTALPFNGIRHDARARLGKIEAKKREQEKNHLAHASPGTTKEKTKIHHQSGMMMMKLIL